MDTSPGMGQEQKGPVDSGGTSEVSGWHGVVRQPHAQVLLRNRDGHHYLVRTKATKLGGVFYFPTGQVSYEELNLAVHHGKSFFASIDVGESIEVPEQSIAGKYYRKDVGNAHFVVSCSVTTKITKCVVDSPHLRWMSKNELLKAAIEQRLNPALLQCLAIDLMV